MLDIYKYHFISISFRENVAVGIGTTVPAGPTTKIDIGLITAKNVWRNFRTKLIVFCLRSNYLLVPSLQIRIVICHESQVDPCASGFAELIVRIRELSAVCNGLLPER